MQLTREESVVIVIDVQGKLATIVQEASALALTIEKLIEASSRLSVPALWVEQVPDKLGPTIPSIANSMFYFHPEREPIIKSSFSAMGEPKFKQSLKSLNRKQVILVGMEAHICVYQTAQDLLADGYEVFVLIDGVSSRTTKNYQLGLSRMEQLGVILTSVEMLVFEWQKTTEGRHFKAITKLFR
ncbi:MAG: isochorismatase family protein [Colwellia sp.]|nr:isochorismatase family protein [Colwellia sp.]